MSDLYTVVVAELDRLERLYGGDRKDGRHAALVAAVQRHKPESYKSDPDLLPLHCGTCCDGLYDCERERFPCEQLQEIAEALGVVVRDGE